MTNRQLAEMMANGWGEWMHEPSHSGICYTMYKYYDGWGNQPVGINKDGQDILVRKWDDLAWEFPTEDLYKEYRHQKIQKTAEIDARLDRLDREVKAIKYFG